MSTVRPWTVLGSTVAFADPWLRVRSDHCRTAEGDVIGPYHVVEYPDWVTIVALTSEGRLLLVREYRHAVGAVLTGLPGGLVDPADGNARLPAAAAAARRELREETGFTAGTLELLTATYPNPSNQTNTAFCFLATGSAPAASGASIGGGEAQELVLDDFVRVLDWMQSGMAVLHTVHVAALWSAAGRIAADRSGRFGSLTARLQHVLGGAGQGRCPQPDLTGAELVPSTVGG